MQKLRGRAQHQLLCLSHEIILVKLDVTGLRFTSYGNSFPEPPSAVQEVISRKKRQTCKEIAGIGEKRWRITVVKQVVLFLHGNGFNVSNRLYLTLGP